MLSPVLDEQAVKSLPVGYEPVLMLNRQIKVADMVEDELLLNLPIIALHDAGACQMAHANTALAGAKPFAGLKDFKLE